MSRKEIKYGLAERMLRSTRSFLPTPHEPKTLEKKPVSRRRKIRVAFIHNEKRIHSGMHTGAAQINKLMAAALNVRGVHVRHFYPRTQLTDAPVHLRGIANLLFFYSLLEHKDQILSYDIIQGTTYTPLPFMPFDVPVVCHFGSTVRGYLDSTPRSAALPSSERAIYKELMRLDVIPEFDLKTLRPLEDIADIEQLAAERASLCVATSNKVQEELVEMGVPRERVEVVHNAIEDYWFDTQSPIEPREPHLVFLGRLGNDVFTLKLKGLTRLVQFYRAFPHVLKTTVCMTTNRKLKEWLRVSFPKHYMYVNLRKDLIPGALAQLYGSILFLSSRYEGFSLSLIEGMSQGLVPIAFRVGVAPEVIRNGENGFLVSSTEEAVERAKQLLGDPKMRLEMAAAAKASTENFRTSTIAADLHILYKRLREERRQANKQQGSKEALTLS